MNDASLYAMAQRQLVNVFIDGLRDKSIKLKVMRSGPNTLDAALKTARDEVNILQRFDLRNGSTPGTFNNIVQGPEPMDVSQIRTRTCHTCGRRGHMSRECPKRNRLHNREDKCLICNSANHDTRNCGKQNHRGNVHAVDRNNEIICFNCGLPGHIKRNCPKLNGSRQGTNNFRRFDRTQQGNGMGFRK